MEIVNVYRQSLPDVKLVGKRYTDHDRDTSDTFAQYWKQCVAEDWPGTLMQCGCIAQVSEDMVGAMRLTEDGFEYWIGAFLAPEATIPEGFEAVEIPAGDVGICWLRGDEANGELFSMEASELSMAALVERGWNFSEEGWFFERYNTERFTKPDANGHVILDVGAYLIG